MIFPCIRCKIRKYKKYTNTKCLKDTTCAIFLESMGFKDVNYEHYMIIWSYHHKYKVFKRPNMCYIFEKAQYSRISNMIFQSDWLTDSVTNPGSIASHDAKNWEIFSQLSQWGVGCQNHHINNQTLGWVINVKSWPII